MYNLLIVLFCGIKLNKFKIFYFVGYNILLFKSIFFGFNDVSNKNLLNEWNNLFWRISTLENNLVFLILITLLFLRHFKVLLSIYAIYYINEFEQLSYLLWNGLNSIQLINTRLLNGLFFIHPITIYLGYAIFIQLASKFLCNCFSNSYHLLTFYFNYFRIVFNILIYIFLSAIALGSLWAQQELDWGGWWSWDIVEVCALFFFIKTVYGSHLMYNNLVQFENSFVISVVFYIVVINIAIRYNILLSIHNFLGLLNNKIWIYLLGLLVSLIFFLTLFILFLKSVILLKFKHSVYLCTNSNLEHISVLLNFFTVTLILLTVLTLNVEFSLFKSFFFLVIYYCLLYRFLDFHNFFTIIFTPWYFSTLPILFKASWRNFQVKSIHYITFFFFLVIVIFNYRLFYLLAGLPFQNLINTHFLKGHNLWQTILASNFYSFFYLNNFQFNSLNVEYFIDFSYYTNKTLLEIKILVKNTILNLDLYNFYKLVIGVTFISLLFLRKKSKYLL